MARVKRYARGQVNGSFSGSAAPPNKRASAPPASTASTTTTTKSRKRRRRADPWTPKRKRNTNPHPRPRRPLPTHFTCRICIEEKPTDEFLRWVNPSRGRFNSPLEAPYNCINHLALNPRRKSINPVCKTCIGASMSARLDMLGARRLHIGCFEPGCQEPWPLEFITRYLPAGDALEKFNLEMFSVWKAEVNDKLITCCSPTGCSAQGLVEHWTPGFPQVVCCECGFRSCAVCLVPWHAGLSCVEHRASVVHTSLSEPEKRTLVLMQTRDGRRCPNCAFVIEKDGGCNSMMCSGCNKYFDWEVAASVVPGAKTASRLSTPNELWKVSTWDECELDLLGISNMEGIGRME